MIAGDLASLRFVRVTSYVGSSNLAIKIIWSKKLTHPLQRLSRTLRSLVASLCRDDIWVDTRFLNNLPALGLGLIAYHFGRIRFANV